MADATVSMVPHHDQTRAAQNSRMMTATILRPTGDGGVSTISSAAGRNANSSSRLACTGRSGTTPCVGEADIADLADFMEPSLHPMQRRVAAAGLDQGVMGAVLDQAAALQRDDAIRRPYSREPVRND